MGLQVDPSRAAYLLCACATAIALATGTARVGAAAQEKSAEQRPIVWGKPVNGIQAGIRLVSQSADAKSNRTVQIQFLLRNTTDQPVDYAYGNAQRIYGWEVSRKADGVWLVEPRWRHWQQEKLEGVVAGAMELQIPAMGEVGVPMDGPKLTIAPGTPHDRLTIDAKPGERVRVRAMPITAAAKGEEWLDRLETGVLTL